MNENIENQRKRLIFRSWHRGTREMDMLLGSFADKYVPSFDEDQLEQYRVFLLNNDPDLYDWYTGKKQPPANETTPILDLFLAHQIKTSVA